MEQTLAYPIGLQDFRTLREEEYVYIDKTRYISEIVRKKARYCFLARPRRFGKSLFLSTLQCFFEGRRELFKGLAVDSLDWDWQPYPVLRLDLNRRRYKSKGELDGVYDNAFKKWEAEYGVIDIADSFSARFENIIEAAHRKTGRQVVILVDEYDKPMVANINNKENIDHYREQLSSVYSNFKSSAEHIRLVFLTGVSRFGKLSIFSDLNNLVDISFLDEYADICGITQQEMLDYLQSGVARIAERTGLCFEDVLAELKNYYDGYRFSENGSDIYNPWSLLNAMSEGKISNSWNSWNDTGLPEIIANSLKRINADLEKVFDAYCTSDELKGLDLINPQPLALLYQTGYLTIKSYNRKINRYRLGIPNEEVKKGLFNVLLPYYIKCRSDEEPKKLIGDMVMYFILGQADDAMKCMQSYFAGVHFKLKMENENNFHNAFYLLMDLVGLETKAESATSDGSIDITVKTEDYIYVIELKYDGSAEAALQHLSRDARFVRPRADMTREIIRIGANFSSKTRCIEDWKIQKPKAL